MEIDLRKPLEENLKVLGLSTSDIDSSIVTLTKVSGGRRRYKKGGADDDDDDGESSSASSSSSSSEEPVVEVERVERAPSTAEIKAAVKLSYVSVLAAGARIIEYGAKTAAGLYGVSKVEKHYRESLCDPRYLKLSNAVASASFLGLDKYGKQCSIAQEVYDNAVNIAVALALTLILERILVRPILSKLDFSNVVKAVAKKLLMHVTGLNMDQINEQLVETYVDETGNDGQPAPVRARAAPAAAAAAPAARNRGPAGRNRGPGAPSLTEGSGRRRKSSKRKKTYKRKTMRR